MQRRNQKVLEETPSPVMTGELRERMGAAAVNAAKAAGYKNAGTIEFLLSGEDFYFMEMNTRIQVEHPITEMLTGIDLVQMQLKIASGEVLPFTQANIKASGASIECRINAEDPTLDFRPCPGTINALHIPGGPGVRIDSAVYQGYAIPPYYDSMIAKLIVHAPTRAEAIMRMRRSLAEFIVDGVKTNIDFQLSLITDPVFEKGDYDIAYLSEKMAAQA
jgi:acetyl-CoA carboxylase biotin carboxylase subunit